MLNRYFNFLRINDEYTFIDPILDHTRFDDEELVLLGDMVEKCQAEKSEELQSIYDSIQKIRTKSHKEFEMLSDQIVNSNFDQQKQHDILRIHSRIENISGLIFATSKRLLIAMKINCHIPSEVRPHIYELWQLVLNMHRSYIRVVELYTQSSKEIMDAIHTVQDEENYIDHFKSE